MQTDSGKWAGAGVKGRTDGENNGQGVVQGRPSLLPHKTQHTAWPWPLLLSGSTAYAWLPWNRARDTYQEARGKLGLRVENRVMVHPSCRKNTRPSSYQQPETLVFVFKLLPQESCPEEGTWTVPLGDGPAG